MLRLRSMTGLAIHARVFAVLLLIEDVRMAALAGLMARELDRTRGDFRHCVGAIVPKLSEALWNQKSSNHEEYQ